MLRAYRMSDDFARELERARSAFEHVIAHSFSFLAEFGFVRVVSSQEHVRYRKGILEVDVYYELWSLELGIDFEYPDYRSSLSEIIRASDPITAKKYRNSIVRTRIGLIAAADRLSNLVREYAERALRDDRVFFRELRRDRERFEKEFALNVLCNQLRPKGAAAFRSGDYAEAARLYERMRARLSPVEMRKLDIALQRQ